MKLKVALRYLSDAISKGIAKSGEEMNKDAVSTQPPRLIHPGVKIRKATVQCKPSVLHLGADALRLSFSLRCGGRIESELACSTG